MPHEPTLRSRILEREAREIPRKARNLPPPLSAHRVIAPAQSQTFRVFRPFRRFVVQTPATKNAPHSMRGASLYSNLLTTYDTCSGGK
jgi:hypothetical protein